MNILISVNNKYLEKASTMLFSVRENTQEELEVYLINHELTRSEVEGFQKSIQKYRGIRLHEITVAESLFDNCSLGNSHFSIEMFYRIIAQWILPETLERILWLDADIIVQKDLAPFYHQDFDDNYLVVCADAKSDCEAVQQIKSKLRLPEKHIYFNSGVLLLNLVKLRMGMTMEQITEYVQQLNDDLTFPDQDILNVMYTGKVKYADYMIYNYQIGTLDHACAEDSLKAVVIHYTGPWKPWNYKCINTEAAAYWHYRTRQGYHLETRVAYVKHFMYASLKKIYRRLLGRS